MTARFLNGFKISDIDQLILALIFRACLLGGGRPQVGEVTCGGSPHLSCKRDQIKMRDYMDRRVTSPTWSPATPCKQALGFGFILI